MAWVLTWSQFINTTLIPFSQFILFQSKPELQQIMENLFFVFISNAFVVPFMSTFTPYFIYKLIKRKLIKEADENC